MDSKTKADNIKHLKSTPFNKPKKYSGYNQYKKNMLIIYLQSECIEKYQFELCSKYDREYGFDAILG